MTLAFSEAGGLRAIKDKGVRHSKYSRGSTVQFNQAASTGRLTGTFASDKSGIERARISDWLLAALMSVW